MIWIHPGIRRVIVLVTFACGYVSLGSGQAAAQFEPAQLFSLSRSGGEAGSTFDLRVETGNQLVEIEKLHFSNPKVSAELKTLDPRPFSEQRVPEFGQFLVTIPDDLPGGRYEVRAEGRNGVSNPRAFLVSEFPNQVPPQVSHDRNAATPLPASTLLHARATAAEVDYYQLSLAKSQPVQIELLAQQLDSRMIGQIKLFDAAGREVGASRGADDVDPVLRTDVDLPPGDYVLAVHDFLYRGGTEYHYQVIFRPTDQAFSLIEPRANADGQLPVNWSTRSFALGPTVEWMANIEAASDSAATIGLPHESTHWFSSQGSDSTFEFEASEGEQLAIEVISQRLGQPTDPRLLLQRLEPQQGADPKLHDVLNVDDSQGLSDGAINLFSTDPVALVTVPTSAPYRLTVRDLDMGQSLVRGQAFRLRVGPPSPGFDLVAYRVFAHSDVNQTQPIGSRLFRGGSELIRVFVNRRDGWNGAVRVRCEGLPQGVTASEVVIAPNQTQTQLTIQAAEDAVSATAPIRVVGQSEDGSLQREAVAATIQWPKGGGRDYIQSRLASRLWVSVSAHDLSPISTTLGDGQVTEVKKGESLKLPIKLVRRDGGKAACVARARDFPGGLKAADVTIPAENSEGECEIKVEAGAATGTYSLWLQVETKIKVKPNPQALERAQSYRSALQSLHDDPAQAANLEAIKAAIAEADKLVEAAKGAANEKELTVFLPTSNATIRVVDP